MAFEFSYGMDSDYVGPGCYYIKYGLGFAEQTEKDVCWSAALTSCVNGAHASNVITTRDVAKMCNTDLFKRKDLQPYEFEDAAGMVINSTLCQIKIKLVAKKWKDTDIIEELCSALEKGDTAMISVNDNKHVQVVVGCTKNREKILLYDTASKAYQRLGLTFLKNHQTVEWVYLFKT